VFLNDGFETGNFSAWSIVQTGADGTATVQSAVVKTGTYAARLSASATTGSFAYARKTLSSAKTDVTVEGDFRILVEGAANANVPILRLYDGGGVRLVSLYRQNQSGDQVSIHHSGAYHTTAGRLPLTTWARFTLHVVTAGTGASTIEVRMNGSPIYSTTSASLGSAGVVTLQIGNETRQQTFSLVADDILATSAN
jgi:hypothetical protein